MADLLVYDAADIARSVSMAAAIDGLRRCFAAGPTHIARDAYPAAGGEFLVMPAVDADSAGVKLLMIQPANLSRDEPTIQGTYVLFDAARGRPVALLDGAALTRLRTPAASAIATDALARHDTTSLGIIGSGPQAAAHIEAILCVRPGIERVVVASRTTANAASAVAALEDIGPTLAVGSIDEAAACDIVCVATRATDPVLTAAMVRPGSHINAVGAYRADMRELSTDLLNASTVTVDELHAAQDEAGDLVIPAHAGEWSWDRVAGDLRTISIGATRRSSVAEITVFKSVGLAVEDLVIARLVVSANLRA
ncbi:MAG: ornithine cyclodeaminase family protein [Ilumatobacteraceae bacterium]